MAYTPVNTVYVSLYIIYNIVQVHSQTVWLGTIKSVKQNQESKVLLYNGTWDNTWDKHASFIIHVYKCLAQISNKCYMWKKYSANESMKVKSFQQIQKHTAIHYKYDKIN